MDIIETLRQDYLRFPQDQTYSIYAPDVYFRDPLTQFWGIKRYQQMIRFIQTWFIDTRMDLYEITRKGNQIQTRWCLRWTAPLPWQPAMAITGRSELQLNAAGLIVSHIDVWDCSRLAVVQQLFRSQVQP